MKPGDHPDFFRMAAPGGASRESEIFLDREGRFWHEGARVENQSLERAMKRWIARHPDDGRLILTNGYDWCYFKAEDAPLIVESLRFNGAPGEAPDGAANTTELQDGTPAVALRLSDDSEEPLDPASLSVNADGAVYARVRSGSLEARFSRHAQTELAPLLVSAEPPVLRVGGSDYPLAPRSPSQ